MSDKLQHNNLFITECLVYKCIPIYHLWRSKSTERK